MTVKDSSIKPGAAVVMESAIAGNQLNQLWFQDEDLALRTALDDLSFLSTYTGGKCLLSLIPISCTNSKCRFRLCCIQWRSHSELHNGGIALGQ